MKEKGKEGRNLLSFRKPVPLKPGKAIGSPKGKKGYDRKEERKRVREEIEKNGETSGKA